MFSSSGTSFQQSCGVFLPEIGWLKVKTYWASLFFLSLDMDGNKLTICVKCARPVIRSRSVDSISF